VKAIQPSLLPGTVPSSSQPIVLRRRQKRPRTVALKVLFLGGGVQSSLMVELALAGELERPDLVIFNDTHDEPWWVYQQVGSLRQRLAAAGIEYVQPSATCWGIMEDLQSTDIHGSMPVFVRNPDGTVGRLRRQCTDYYKVQPGNLAIRWHLVRTGIIPPRPGTALWAGGWPPETALYQGNTAVAWEDYAMLLPSIPRAMAVECWFGYSTDEKLRAARKGLPSWQVARYPLLEKGLSRDDCVRWYATRGRRAPFKSSCLMCPFRSDEAWLWMQRTMPQDFETACRHDETLRAPEIKHKGRAYAKVKGQMYLHRQCIPLREIDFEALVAQKRKQSSMFELELIDDCRADGGFSCMS
jgi:hypothetical protein